MKSENVKLEKFNKIINDLINSGKIKIILTENHKRLLDEFKKIKHGGKMKNNESTTEKKQRRDDGVN